MEIIKYLTLDLSDVDRRAEIITAKQGDRKTRFVYVRLTVEGAEYNIPPGASAFFNVDKPDGHFCYNECDIEENIIKIELTNQTLAAAGMAYCDIDIRQSNGEKILSCEGFMIDIKRSAKNENAILSSNEMSAIDKRIQGYIDSIIAAEGRISGIETAFNALMRDTAQAEDQRQTDEEERRSAEAERITSEQNREAAEAKRVALFGRLGDFEKNTAPSIIQTASGAEFITVYDSANRQAVGFKVVGKTEQNGTPSPDYPQPIRKVAQGTEIKFSGKNLWNFGDVNGVYSANINFPLPKGTYTLSCEVNSSDVNSLKTYFSFRNNKGTIASLLLERGKRNCHVVALSDNVEFVRIYAGESASNSADDTFSVSNIMLQPGSDVYKSEYEPYISGGTIVTPCDLYEGDVWYPLEGRVERHNMVWVLDGSESDASILYENGCFNIPVDLAVFNATTKGYCNQYITINTHTLNDGEMYLFDSWYGNKFVFKNSSISTIEELKNRLAENPLVIVRKIPAPITEQYDPQTAATAYSTTNVIQTPTELTGDMELNYVADTKIYIDNKFTELQAALLEAATK